MAFALANPQRVGKLILMGGGTGGASPFATSPNQGIKHQAISAFLCRHSKQSSLTAMNLRLAPKTGRFGACLWFKLNRYGMMPTIVTNT